MKLNLKTAYYRVSAFAVLLFLLLIGCTATLAQKTNESEKVENYLNSYLKSFNDRPGTLRNHFVGFLNIDEALKTQLENHFPYHHFYVAKTLFSHWITDDGSANVLVVTDSGSGDIVGVRWAIWFSGGTESFDHILESYRASSRADALEKVSVLSRLLVSLNGWEVGNVKQKGMTIVAELGGSIDPWRLLKVDVDRKFKFGKLSFVNLKK